MLVETPTLLMLMTTGVLLFGQIAGLMKPPGDLDWSFHLWGCVAGLFGCSITQFFSFHTREKSRTVLIGDMLASIALGFAVVAYRNDTAVAFDRVLVQAAVVGSGGVLVWRGIVLWAWPKWLPKIDNHHENTKS